MSTGSSSSTEFEGPICISSDCKREAKLTAFFNHCTLEFTGMKVL